MSIELALAIAATVCTIIAASPKSALWWAVLLLCVAHLVKVLPA